MSELKADKTFVFGEECEAYKKSEADKFIADLEESNKKEVGQLLIKIAELKNRIAPKQSDKTLQERLNEVCEKHGVSTLQDLDWAFCESEKRNTKYCIEADKVIAELEESHKKEVGQLLMKIVGQKSEIERLEILCANNIHDCDNLEISNEQAKRAARTLIKKMNHNKYKRCLAMARWCRTSARCDEGLGAFKYRDWYWKWFKRWFAIAEQFKEAK